VNTKYLELLILVLLYLILALFFCNMFEYTKQRYINIFTSIKTNILNNDYNKKLILNL